MVVSSLHGWLTSARTSARIAFAYTIVATLWIVFSDSALFGVWSDAHAAYAFGLIKGLAFVGVTAAVLYFLVDRQDRQRNRIVADLRGSNDAFAKVFEASPNPIAVSDIATGTLVELNDAWSTATGFAREAALGRSTVDLGLWVDPADRSRVAADVRRHGRVRDREARMVLRGQERTCILFAERIEFRGRPSSLWQMVDVTDRQRAQEALRASEERFRAFMDATPACSWIKDENGRFIYLNKAWEAVAGANRDGWIGKTAFEVMPHDAAERGRASDLEVRRTGRPLDIVESPVETDGRRHHRRIIRFPIGGPSGQQFVGGIALDITKEQQADEAAREAALRLRMAVEAGNIGLWDWDLRTDKVFFSPEWKHQIGYADDEISDDFTEWRDHLHPDDLDRSLRAVDAYLKSPSGEYRVEFRFRHKDGSYRWILAQGSLVYDESGKPIRMLGSHIDITERKRIEDQLVQATKMEAVGQLTGGIAHDFNNLLGVVIGNIDLLSNRVGGDPRSAEMAADALKGALRGAELVKRLLAFSRRQPLQPKVIDLASVVESIVPLLRRTLGEQIQIVAGCTSQTWPIYADPVQLESVALNLAVNARDAMPKGGTLFIDCANVSIDEHFAPAYPDLVPGDYAVVTVRDTGTGMTPEVLARVFEPFFTTKAKGEGSGLGLSMVFGYMKQSGGTVKIASELGQGTSVRLYLPRAAAGSAVAAADVRTEVAPATGHEPILVVEDDEAVRAVTVRMLQNLGYAVSEADCAAAALRRLDDGDDFQLLFTDVVMPGAMNGMDLALEAHRRRPELKILFTSGFTGQAGLGPDIAALGARLLAKPFRQLDLAQQVRAALDR